MENQINTTKVSFLKPLKYNDTPPIQLFVKGLDGKTMTVIVKKGELILRIKEQIFEKTKIPILGQRLIFGGKDLKDGTIILDSNLQDASILHLILRLKGGAGERDAMQKVADMKLRRANVKNVWEQLEMKNGNYKNYDYADVEFGRKILSDIRKKGNIYELFKNVVEKDRIPYEKIKAIIHEHLGAGNCGEFAAITKLKLVESTRNQYVYKVSMRSPYDHAFCLTYPEKINTLWDITDLSLATVVDGWADTKIYTLKQFLDEENVYGKVIYLSDLEVVSCEKATGNSVSQTVKNEIKNKVDQLRSKYGGKYETLLNTKVTGGISNIRITGKVNDQRTLKDKRDKLDLLYMKGMYALFIDEFMEIKNLYLLKNIGVKIAVQLISTNTPFNFNFILKKLDFHEFMDLCKKLQSDKKQELFNSIHKENSSHPYVKLMENQYIYRYRSKK